MRYAHLREEIAFLFGYCWSVLRPMALELGRRLVAAGTFVHAEDTFYLVTEELREAIEARGSGTALPRLGQLAAERRELREARKRHRPPAVVPAEAMQNKQIAPMMEAQILDNDKQSIRAGPASSELPVVVGVAGARSDRLD